MSEIITKEQIPEYEAFLQAGISSPTIKIS